MIISCEYCKKKFNVDSNLIGDNGRLLECSSCKHRWFFKKEKIHADRTKDNETEKSFQREQTDQVKNLFDEKLDENKANNFLHKPKKKSVRNFNFLNIITVFIISFIALVIVIDTFKSPIGKIVPNIEFLLYNLYETFKNIILFFNDLF